jgi:hypothetical protein
VLGSFLIGMSAQAVKICVDTIVQENVEDEFRGRVFAFYDMLFNCAFVASAAVASLTMPESGKSYVILISVSVLYALAAGLYFRVVGWSRPIAPLAIAELHCGAAALASLADGRRPEFETRFGRTARLIVSRPHR